MVNKLIGDIIGLDVGSRRIGVARVSTQARLPEPLKVIDMGAQEPFSAVLSTIDTHSAVAVVVGLPRGLDGQETSQTKYCRDFAKKLEQKVKIPVFLIDEAGTTKEAEQRAKGVESVSIDSVAAMIILEDFLTQLDRGEI